MRILFKLAILVSSLSLLLVSGCTKTFRIPDAKPPAVTYTKSYKNPVQMTIQDARNAGDKKFSVGTLNTVLEGIENEIRYLGKNVTVDLNARGINMQYDETGKAGAVGLKVHKYRIRNLRTSGFSPYYTFTTFSADLMYKGQSRRITSYFKNGKVPVFSFSEVEEPCYTIPVSLLVKEVASKINSLIFGLSASNDAVDALYKDITDNYVKYSYFKVLELGYSNNRRAVPYLVKLTEHNDSMMRATALSALGMLRAVDQLELLKKKYATTENTEKYMALKSIGDLGTAESKAFLDSVKSSADYSDMAIREVLEMYY